MQKDGTVLAEMDSRSRYDAPTTHREIAVPKDKLDELAAMVDRGELFHWAKTKWNKIDVLDGDTVDISFDYADGSYASLYDNNEMPKEAIAAMEKVQSFLWKLLKDAPQVEKQEGV